MSQLRELVERKLIGKVRRRAVRLRARRPATGALHRPLISFSFDDVPESGAIAGGRLLEQAGVRGTYYINAGLVGRQGELGRHADLSQIRALAEAGHEIGCHTDTHINCGWASEAKLTAELDGNAEAFAGWGLPSAQTFAYPYGEVGLRAKRMVGERFPLSRAVHRGVVRQGSDLAQAPGVGIEGPGGERLANRWLDRIAGKPSWLILYTHDVEAEPTPYGCTPEALERLIAKAQAIGEVVTVAEGARRMTARAPVATTAAFRMATVALNLSAVLVPL